MFDIAKCERIEIPQGALYLGPSKEKQSVGYLELNPRSSLTLHSRPAKEQLSQVKNRCEMVVFWDRKPVTTLYPENTFTIPANTLYIHVNPFDEISLTYWDFYGDIREIIENIRKSAQ